MLVGQIDLPCRAKDDEVRRIARQEYDAMDPDVQWKWATDQQVSLVSNGVAGRFQNYSGSTALVKGASVILHGLTARSDLNGCTGSCKEFLQDSQRWTVVLLDGTHVNIRVDNLQNTPSSKPEPPVVIGAPRLTWTECVRTTERKSELREAINRAAGGSEPSPQQVAIALSKTLTPAEKEACAWHCDGNDDAALAMVGKKLIEIVLRYAKSFCLPVLFLCWALRECGWTSHCTVRNKLALSIPQNTWRRSISGKVPPKKLKHDNGRTNFRALSVGALRGIMLKRSNPTSRPFKGPRGYTGGLGHKRKVKNKFQDKRPMKQVMAVDSSFRSIYHSNPEIKDVIKESTLYSYMDRDLPEFQRVKRKVDCCGKCRQWDHQVFPACRRTLRRWRQELEEVWPGFLTGYIDDLGNNCNMHQVKNMCNEVVQHFFRFVWARYQEILASTSLEMVALQLPARRAVVKIRHELLTCWPDLKTCECKVACDCVAEHGMLEVIGSILLLFITVECGGHGH